jgi:hypothetical protein
MISPLPWAHVNIDGYAPLRIWKSRLASTDELKRNASVKIDISL